MDRERVRVLLSLGVGIIATISTSCVSADDGAFRDWKGRVVVSTPSEIAQTQAIVRAARSAEDLPKGSEGMIVADGIVEDVRQKASGRASATFKVERVISGDLCVGQTIAIETSSIDKGGVGFLEKSRYRVAIVLLDGAYRTWSWMGTSQIEERGR